MAMKDPPRVLPLTVVLEVDPLKYPPPEEVRMIEASVLLFPESVMMTVMVVVAAELMGLFPAVTETWAADPPELPEPVMVPLVRLFCLLLSEMLHPIKEKKASSDNRIRTKTGDLLTMDSNPNW